MDSLNLAEYIDECKKYVTKSALKRTQGNLAKASEIMGVSLTTIQVYKKRYNL